MDHGASHVQTYVHVRAHMQVHVDVGVHVCGTANVCACMCARMRAGTKTCIQAHVYTYLLATEAEAPHRMNGVVSLKQCPVLRIIVVASIAQLVRA